MCKPRTVNNSCREIILLCVDQCIEKLCMSMKRERKFNTSLTHIIPRINCVIHNRKPTLEGSDLEEREIGHWYVVKVNWRIDPFCSVLLQAGINIRSNLIVHSLQGYYISTLYNIRCKYGWIYLFIHLDNCI